jgi:hypothetical protein
MRMQLALNCSMIMRPDTSVGNDPCTPIAGPSPLLRLLASLGRPEEQHDEVPLTHLSWAMALV